MPLPQQHRRRVAARLRLLADGAIAARRQAALLQRPGPLVHHLHGRGRGRRRVPRNVCVYALHHQVPGGAKFRPSASPGRGTAALMFCSAWLAAGRDVWPGLVLIHFAAGRRLIRGCRLRARPHRAPLMLTSVASASSAPGARLMSCISDPSRCCAERAMLMMGCCCRPAAAAEEEAGPGDGDVRPPSECCRRWWPYRPPPSAVEEEVASPSGASSSSSGGTGSAESRYACVHRGPVAENTSAASQVFPSEGLLTQAGEDKCSPPHLAAWPARRRTAPPDPAAARRTACPATPPGPLRAPRAAHTASCRSVIPSSSPESFVAAGHLICPVAGLRPRRSIQTDANATHAGSEGGPTCPARRTRGVQAPLT